jgi:hypothetical protein
MDYELWWKPSLKATSWHTHLVAHSNHNSVAIRSLYFQYAHSHLPPVRSNTSSSIAITVPALCPETGLFPVVLCTWTQTFLPNFGKNRTIANGTVTRTLTLRCSYLMTGKSTQGKISTGVHTICLQYYFGALPMVWRPTDGEAPKS